MHDSVTQFVSNEISTADVADLRVLEVGSRDINGSVRPLIEQYDPEEYIGVDIVDGERVDKVVGATQLVDEFGSDSFDLVVSTEVLEHVRDWRDAISNMKRICKPEGTLVLTTRSVGKWYHGHPNDYWRYSLDDFREIFIDMDIRTLDDDPSEPGVFARIRKPTEFDERELESIKLHSIITGERKRQFGEGDYWCWNYAKTRLSSLGHSVADRVISDTAVDVLKRMGLYKPSKRVYERLFITPRE